MSIMAARKTFMRGLAKDIALALLAVAVSGVVLLSMVVIAVSDLGIASTSYSISFSLSASLVLSLLSSKLSFRIKSGRNSDSLLADLAHAASVTFLACGAFGGALFVARVAYQLVKYVFASASVSVHAILSLFVFIIASWIVFALAVGPNWHKPSAKQL